jgi:predicted aspartyl protease
MKSSLLTAILSARQNLFLLFAVLTISCFSYGQKEVPPQIGINPNPADHSQLSSARSRVPFQLHAGYMVIVHGEIGGFTGLKFLLDTGATNSVVSRKVVDLLSLARRPGRVISFDKTVTAEWVTVPDLRFGDIQEHNVSMLVLSLAHLQPDAGLVDAVIGLDILRKRNFNIDFESNNAEFAHVGPASSSVPMTSSPICLTVEMKIGDSRVRLIVDMGMSGILLYQDRVERRIPQLKIENKGTGWSVGGGMRVAQVIAPRVRIGDIDLDRRVFLMKGPPGNLLPGIDGYVGVSALRAGRVTFNFDEGTLSWKR